jgi:cation diffusion facilitator CzcD-associated flavoprotein CzcO
MRSTEEAKMYDVMIIGGGFAGLAAPRTRGHTPIRIQHV